MLVRHQEGMESRMRKDGAHAKRVSCATDGESLNTFPSTVVLCWHLPCMGLCRA